MKCVAIYRRSRGCALMIIETEPEYVAEHLCRLNRYGGPRVAAELVGIIEGPHPRAINLAVRKAFDPYRPRHPWFRADKRQVSELKKLFPSESRIQCWEIVQPWFGREKKARAHDTKAT